MDVFPLDVMVFFFVLGAVLALVMYHRQTTRISVLALRIAHLESSLDMLLDSQRELHKLILQFLSKKS